MHVYADGNADKYADGSAATYRFRGSTITGTPGDVPVDAPGANCPTKGRPSWPDGEQVTVREVMGYSPWYFHVPDAANASSAAKYAAAFEQLADPQGFAGPWARALGWWSTTWRQPQKHKEQVRHIA